MLLQNLLQDETELFMKHYYGCVCVCVCVCVFLPRLSSLQITSVVRRIVICGPSGSRIFFHIFRMA